MTEAEPTAQEYRERAERARQLADLTIDGETRKLLLEIAATYDKLAERAERLQHPN